MLKILIVDDSVFSQKTTCGFLKSIFEQSEFFFASDGQEGFSKYKEIKPDYTFVDLLMPIVDGKELIKLIQEYDCEAKIFVLSADVQKNVREELEKSNILAFINKPLTNDKKNLICSIMKDTNHE